MFIWPLRSARVAWLVIGTLLLLLLHGPLLQAVQLAGDGLGQTAIHFDHYLVVPPPQASGPNGVVLPEPAAEHADLGLPVPMILGYYYNPGNDPSGFASLEAYRSKLTGIVPFWYTIHRTGAITGAADPQVMRFAEKNHLWVFALIQNMNGSAVYHALLNDPVAARQAIDQMLSLCESEGFDGVNLDFEGIAPADRQAYTNFVAALSQQLHAYGYYVTLSVPAETQDEPQNGWTGAYDYKALAKNADLLMIMAYDQHSTDSTPGTIASSGWVGKVARYATATVPPSKLILGIPVYGYDWAAGQSAIALSYSQAVALADQFHGGNLTSDHFSYTQGGVQHQVWYENALTFDHKVSLAVGYDLRGIVLWRLGIEDPRIWQELGD